MARVTPIIKSQNAGEWSPLVDSRVDLAKQPASLRRALNAVITPQGPTIRRSGTALQAPVFNENQAGHMLLPFIFDNDQALQVEASHEIFRFHTEDGILAGDPVTVTAASPTPVFKLTAAGHATAADDYVVLVGFDVDQNLNGRIVKVTAVAGNDVTLDLPARASVGSIATAKLRKVYQIDSPYTNSQIPNLRYTADQDTLFLWSGNAPHKLQRFGALDWRVSDVDFKDGPYAPTNDTAVRLTPSGGTGTIVPVMTADNAPSGVASASSVWPSPNLEAFRAFDNDPSSYWQSQTSQAAWLQYQFAASTVVNGYTITMGKINSDVSYASVDYAPSDWTFEASNDAVTWTVLDSQVGYVLYDGGRSAYFEIKNETGYLYYRINVKRVTRNGALPVIIARLAMSSPDSAPITFTASATSAINDGQGFLATDVGRLLRFKGSDGFWRWFKILTRVSSTVITARCMGDPLPDLNGTTEWRLGMFSDTTGYPTCAVFFEDRLVMGGVRGYPDYVLASVTGKYEVMSQTNVDGSVSDDNALVLKLNARKQGRIMWLSSDLRSLLVGTGSGEWVISSADPNAALSARTAKARPASRRGSAGIEPLQIDNQTIFVQRANRTLREMSYVFNVDGYQSPSLSLLSSHLGAQLFQQLEYAAEPHALAFVRRGDGTVAALTYNKEEDVVGWQVFDFNGIVESMSVIPAQDGTQDALWMIVRRSVGGVSRRFIERMTRFWDFNSTIADAKFVDCHATYSGSPITTVYGLYNYEGAELRGLADGSPITPVTVVDGKVTLDQAASNIVLGLGYTSLVETSRFEGGSATGSAQGKLKRINEMKLRLWSSYGGQYAVRGNDGEVTDYVNIEYLTPDTDMDGAPVLFTGDTLKLDMPQNFGVEGTLLYRQTADNPLPFNVVAIMPTIVVMDG